MASIVTTQMEKILNEMGKTPGSVRKGDLETFGKHVFAALTTPDAFKRRSEKVIAGRIKDADDQYWDFAARLFRNDPQIGFGPITVVIGVKVKNGRFYEEIVEPKTRERMEACDRDPRSIAHEIAAELTRNREETFLDYPHAGIHLFLNKKNVTDSDQIEFRSNDGTPFDVYINKDPDYKYDTNYISPFDTGYPLKCTSGSSVKTGSMKPRKDQRYFKFTIVSPGETPKGGPGKGKPAHLDPHIIGHDEE